MTLQHYLNHRRSYEYAAAFVVVLMITATLSTTEVMENLRKGAPGNWSEALATELTSGIVVLLLFGLLMKLVERLDLTWATVRWRILWHIPAFIAFSLIHIAGFTLLRKGLWALQGESYPSTSLGWTLLFEMRKDLLTYCLMITFLSGYRFILNRLQGEAKFLSNPAGTIPQVQDRKEFRSQFLVKMLNREYLVAVADVDWIGSAGNYVLMHCGDRSYPMRYTLSGLNAELDPKQFMRVHRTAIVNLSRVESLHTAGEMSLTLRGGEQIPMSKTYASELLKTTD